MLGFAWLTVRQAQEALRAGRLDEALGLLNQPTVRAHKRANDAIQRSRRGTATQVRGQRLWETDPLPRPAARVLLPNHSAAKNVFVYVDIAYRLVYINRLRRRRNRNRAWVWIRAREASAKSVDRL